MKFTYWDYQNKKCSGEDYIRDHYIGENNEGEVLPIELRPNRFIYAIKRDLKDYYFTEYSEYKVYDIDNPNFSCLDKQKEYGDERPSLLEYWNHLKKQPDMRNYIDTRNIFRD